MILCFHSYYEQGKSSLNKCSWSAHTTDTDTCTSLAAGRKIVDCVVAVSGTKAVLCVGAVVPQYPSTIIVITIITIIIIIITLPSLFLHTEDPTSTTRNNEIIKKKDYLCLQSSILSVVCGLETVNCPHVLWSMMHLSLYIYIFIYIFNPLELHQYHESMNLAWWLEIEQNLDLALRFFSMGRHHLNLQTDTLLLYAH